MIEKLTTEERNRLVAKKLAEAKLKEDWKKALTVDEKLYILAKKIGLEK